MTRPGTEMRHEITLIERTIFFKVAGVPPMDRLYGTVRFLPDAVNVLTRNGEARVVRIVGHRATRGNGGLGKDRYTNTYHLRFPEDRKALPDWAHALIAEAERVR